MGTEILRPQDCLRSNYPSVGVYPRRNYSSTPTPTASSNKSSCRKQTLRPESRKRVVLSDDSKSSPNKNLLVGQVTIMKRGESLGNSKPVKQNLKKTFSDDPMVYGTERLGPDPGRVPKFRVADLKIQNGVAGEYAGSAFYNSPSPRALPLPTFAKRVVDDSATKDLRRLLRLD